jgi:hypothetical protein
MRRAGLPGSGCPDAQVRHVTQVRRGWLAGGDRPRGVGFWLWVPYLKNWTHAPSISTRDRLRLIAGLKRLGRIRLAIRRAFVVLMANR